MQQARALQHSEAFAEYRQRRVVVEHRLARLVQLGIRQSRYFGRAKTRFQLYLRRSQGRQRPGRWHGQLCRQYRGRMARANSDPHFARVGLPDQILLPDKGFPAGFLGVLAMDEYQWPMNIRFGKKC